MSVSGVSGSDPLQTSVAQAAQTRFQQIQNQFQKVGKDLQSGNLSQAQSDFATLTRELPNSQQSAAAPATSAAATTVPTNTLAKAFQALGQDLQAGNLSAAQADFTTIQQDAQQNPGQAQGHRHHHQAGASSQQQPNNTLLQAFGTLGQALQSGSLSSAQLAYSTLQTDLQQAFPNFGATSGGGAGTATSGSTGSVNVAA
jgi:hypothetical protein